MKARRKVKLIKILLRQAVLWTFLFCLVNRFFVTGWGRPLRIESGSMVPTFYGPRYDVACDECRSPFSCGADGTNERALLTCPNCGFAENPISTARLEPGERIVIDRLAVDLSGGRLKRFDVVVFRHPESPSHWVVKRIAALPGESVAFHEGNLWINGTLYRRTLDELRKTAIPYPYGRWVDESTESRRQFSFHPNEPVPHFTPMRHFQEETAAETAAISPGFYSTRNPYNQLRNERKEDSDTPTDEILLHFPPRLLEYEIEITTKRETISLARTDDRTLSVRRNGRPFATADISFQNSVWLSTADRTFQLGDAGSTKLSIPLPDDAPAKSFPKVAPIVLSHPATGAHFSPDDFRDVVLRIPLRFFAPEKRWTVPANGWFVLGDNASISEDSRFWSIPFVNRDAILGIPRRANGYRRFP